MVFNLLSHLVIAPQSILCQRPQQLCTQLCTNMLIMKIYPCPFPFHFSYVAWNVHEPIQGTYVFEGMYDVESFIRLAQEQGLLVIVRAGIKPLLFNKN